MGVLAAAAVPTRDDAAALLAALRRAGVALTLDGHRVAIDAPAGTLTPKVRAACVRAKPALVTILEGEARLLSAARELDPGATIRREAPCLRRSRAGADVCARCGQAIAPSKSGRFRICSAAGCGHRPPVDRAA